MIELCELFNQWRDARDGLEAFAEVGDRAGWEEAKHNSQSLEDVIFAITGKRPPYATGWGVDLSREEIKKLTR